MEEMGLAAKIRKQFFKQKYRFDLAVTYIALLNFALLAVTASDKVMPLFGIKNTSTFVLMFIPLSFVMVWIFGYFMDTYVKSQRMTELEVLQRSPSWKKVYDDLDEIKKLLKDKEMEEKTEKINLGFKTKAALQSGD